MPLVLRSGSASLWGYYLRSWRYDGETDNRVAEALLRESWLPQQWKKWEEEKLPSFLDRAARGVPYYRNYWQNRRLKGDSASWEKLENWPILTKKEVLRDPKAFVCERAWRSPLYLEHTGGTTGAPLLLWQGGATLKQWYALFEARWRGWYGVTRHDRWAIIGGQRIVSEKARTPPFWIWNNGLKQLYISAYHLFPEHTEACIQAIVSSKAQYLLGYTSAIYFFSKEILLRKLPAPKLKVVITNAEPLTLEQRQVIERAFGCPVRETYGMAEMVAAAGECEHGSLHLWPEAGHVEVIENGQAVLPGHAGDLICTGLLNEEMPLIRYEVGDRAALVPDTERPCLCGRLLPRLLSMEGRKHDILTLKDGRKVWYFNPVFSGLPIREAQVIQENEDCFRILLVCDRPLVPDEEKEIKGRMKDLVGEISVIIEYTAFISREKNGKFRSVISRVQTRGQKFQGEYDEVR